MKGAKYQPIASELEKHAGEELNHALQIAKPIDDFNGTPRTEPKAVKLSDKAEDMLRFDIENERVTILNYRTRIRQAEARASSPWAKSCGKSSRKNRSTSPYSPTPWVSIRRIWATRSAPLYSCNLASALSNAWMTTGFVRWIIKPAARLRRISSSEP